MTQVPDDRRAGCFDCLANKSIMFVVNCLDYGGAEVQVTRIAEGMHRRGWAVCVVSMLPPGPLQAILQKAGIKVLHLNMQAGIPNPAAILRLRRILRHWRPDVVHSHIAHANILTRLTRLIAPIPVLISTAHNIREGGWGCTLAYRYTDRLTDLTTNVSRAAVDRYVGVRAAASGRIRYVPNGVDTSRFKPDPISRQRLRQALNLNDEFAWLAIGRFHEQKDYPTMIRAFKEVAESRQTCLLLAGIGPTQHSVQRLVGTLGLSNRVRFLGIRTDIPELMNAADAFILSSAWEGMPLVLQEASACTLPIVATDVGGNSEVVRSGVSGFLVPPHEPSNLAKAMTRLLNMSHHDRESFGRAGREHIVTWFALERVLDCWEDIYNELLDNELTPELQADPRDGDADEQYSTAAS